MILRKKEWWGWSWLRCFGVEEEMEVGDNRQRARPTRGDGCATPQPILLKISDFILQKKCLFVKSFVWVLFINRVVSKVAFDHLENLGLHFAIAFIWSFQLAYKDLDRGGNFWKIMCFIVPVLIQILFLIFTKSFFSIFEPVVREAIL